MKKVFYLAFIVVAAHTAEAQVSIGDSLKKHYLSTYEQALKLSDVQLGINSLNNALVEMTGTQSLLYKDTLSILYFSNKAYYSAFLLAEEVSKADPSNTKALARTGECYQAGSDYKNAAEVYEKVAPILKNPYFYYQLAICQYSLKKPDESLVNADKALADTNSNHIGVVFILPDGQEQQVPVSAAAINLKGVVMMDKKDFAKALEYYRAALKIYPNFEGARRNADTCEKKVKGTKPTAKTKGQ